MTYRGMRAIRCATALLLSLAAAATHLPAQAPRTASTLLAFVTNEASSGSRVESCAC